MKISDVDPNFKIDASVEEPDVKYYDPTKPPFRLMGVMPPDPATGDIYRRLPKEVADATNEGVSWLSTFTAGGRIRFTTDSPYVIITVSLPELHPMAHMALTGIAGCAMYCYEGGEQHFCNIVFPTDKTYAGKAKWGDRRMRDCVIYMPLYNDVSRIYIGIAEDAHVYESPAYAIDKPVVFYGSSITQGGCASKPSSDYVSLLSRWLDSNYVNLGFSGSAKGEPVIAEYIAKMDMSCFVMDYDHNAPSPEHLEKTHYPFYKIIRDAHPDLPIIMLTRPDNVNSQDRLRRLGVVTETYLRARKEGDTNVFLIDGATFCRDMPRNDASVDCCHPTDLGFYFMAKAVLPVLKTALGMQ